MQKKIRGWKRRKRAVVYWKNRNLHLDKETLKLDARDYVKVWIYPFLFCQSVFFAKLV
jgi:hypothetical protein